MTKQCIEKNKIRYWLSESFSWSIITSQYMEHVWWQKWWIRANIKGFNFVFWKYMFIISKLWNKREEHINTNYDVTGWMLCVIPHIREDVFKMHKINIIFRWAMLSKLCLLDNQKKSYMELLISSVVNILYSIIRMIYLTVIILSGTVNILLMVTFIYGIINTHYHPPHFLVL